MDSTQAEATVLGAALMSEKAADQAAAKLAPNDFYRDAHRTVFRAISTLRNASRPADSATVSELLARSGELDHIGGAVALYDLTVEVPSAANQPHYVDLVIDHSRRRALAEAARRLGADALDGTKPLPSTLLEATTTLEGVRPASRRLKVYVDDELDRVPAAQWLVGGMVTEGLTIVYGPANVGKSFLTLDWALSVTSGRPWFGRAVGQRNVVYVAAEGSAGMRDRRKAWRTGRSTHPKGFHVVAEPVDLLDPRQAGDLQDVVVDANAGLLVIDTWARCFTGDENSSTESYRAITWLDRLRLKHGCAVMVVHHTGHDSSRARGSTALRDAADTEVRVGGGQGMLQVVCEKQKDAAFFRSQWLRLEDAGPSAVLVEDERPDPVSPLISR